MNRWIGNTPTGSIVQQSLLYYHPINAEVLFIGASPIHCRRYNKNLIDIPNLPRSLCIRFVLLLSMYDNSNKEFPDRKKRKMG